ncbi:MAG: lysylphosphatidylglycerol synthase transmembrane domain-containing protein, partial [Anaerolineae bacterium]
MKNETGRRAHWRTGAALLLAGIAAWLSIRQVHWPALVEVLAGVRPAWLLLALASALATTALKAARWHVLLRPCRPRATPGRLVRILLVGQMANSLLPRLGDAARAVLMGPRTAAGIPAVLGTLVVEKALDGVMGLGMLLALLLWTPLPAWLRAPVFGLAALTAALLLLLAAARAGRTRLGAFGSRIAARLPPRVRAPLARLVRSFLLGLDLLHTPGDTVWALLLSAAVWGLGVSTNLLTLQALRIEAPAWTAVLVIVTSYAATFLPTVPAQIGIVEYA